MARKKKAESERGATPAPASPPAQRRSARSGSTASSPGRAEAEDTTARLIREAGSPDLASGPSYQEIAEAAYHRYLGRGGGDGADFDDWIAAERELRLRQTGVPSPGTGRSRS